ncbi:MAG: hypothetical protein CL845_07545 [Crocinitomicaceae bacterium]|nr:hypothetical protein [Crocinitomicaceae bacterium]
MSRLFLPLFSAFIFSCAVSVQTYAQCDNADYTVQASNFSYEPNLLSIEVGQSVAFVNMGGYHDVNGEINSLTGSPYNNPEDFYLNPISGNSSGVCIGVVSFDVPGTYTYDCSIGNHAAYGMVASISVEMNEALGGCTYEFACNFNSDASFDDGSCEITSCVLQGDITGDGAVAVDDLLVLLSTFGQTL